jgi:hypothetical protein
MTPEDLEQIRAIVNSAVSSAISANSQVLFAAMRAIEEHVDLRFDGLSGGVNGVEQRSERIERILDRLDTRFTAFEAQMAGIISQSPRLRNALAN